jgi:hypothetical protein
MLATLKKLIAHIQKPENNPHVFTKGRSVKHELSDTVNDGFAEICETADLCAVPNDDVATQEVVATSDDVGVS